jgi:hypothetical protein
LQVFVSVAEPDALLRPEMLCQVRFLGSDESAPGGQPSSVLVPRRLVEENQVWVLDESGERARRRTVELGSVLGEDIEVRSGITGSDKLIDQGRERLTEGARVQTKEQG